VCTTLYCTTLPQGIEAELQALSAAAATKLGAAELIALAAAAPLPTDRLVLATLNHLIPLDTNAPSPEVTAAVQALRTARVAAAAIVTAAASGSATSSVASSADAGVEYIVPALAGLGREGVATVLPQVRHSVVHLVKCFVQTAYRA
jgi:hypothetical protein